MPLPVKLAIAAGLAVLALAALLLLDPRLCTTAAGVCL